MSYIKIIGCFIGFDFYLLIMMSKNGMFLFLKLNLVIVGYFFFSLLLLNDGY